MTEKHSQAKRKAWAEGVYAERKTYKGGQVRKDHPHPWTHSEITEHERESRDDDAELDNR